MSDDSLTYEKIKHIQEQMKELVSNTNIRFITPKAPEPVHYWVHKNDPERIKFQDYSCLLRPPEPVYHMNCLTEDRSKRLFPESRHRSKRIHKKLVKRFGGEFRMKPAIFAVKQRGLETIMAHPSFQKDFQEIGLR